MKYDMASTHVDDVALLGMRRGDCTKYAQPTVARWTLPTSTRR
jgi:hypothetical protein